MRIIKEGISDLAKRYKISKEEVRDILSLDPSGQYDVWLLDQYVEGKLGKDENGKWMYSGQPAEKIIDFIEMTQEV